jgi:hypothetical protein
MMTLQCDARPFRKSQVFPIRRITNHHRHRRSRSNRGSGTAGPDLGERWPSRLVAKASENRLNMRHEEGANARLRYFRHCADGGQEDDHEFLAASRFLYRNGQSLDWVFVGDPRGMICNAAANARMDEDGGIPCRIEGRRLT